MIDINFFNNSGHKFLPGKKLVESAKQTLSGESINNITLNIIINDDDYILELNKKFLGHDYYTDVITFIVEETPLEAEIYISADTAKRQASEAKVSLSNELMRLTIHGALHIAGYDDSTDELRNAMRQLEDRYLDLINAQKA